ncbi:hypothetical protein ACFL6C_07725 [Myxococcota bacterium]
MSSLQPPLFSNLPKDHFGIFGPQGVPDAKKIASLLDYKRPDVSAATKLPLARVRLEPHRIPAELVERLTEWGTALNLVAGFFKDTDRTILWFKTANPMLGNVSPRDMIRVGRFKKLLRFIQSALNENAPG